MAEALNPADWGAAPVDGPEHWGAVPAEQATTSPVQQMLADFGNQGVAAGQRTTPVISAYGAPISEDVQERDDGAAMYVDPKTGEVVPTDSNKHVILRDPSDNKLKVFARSPETNEGVLASTGRLIGTGMAGSGAVAPVAKTVPPAITAAERIGVDLPKAIATDNPLTKLVGQALVKAPGPLGKSIENSRNNLQGAVGRAADMAGGTTDAAVAGDNFSNAIETSFKPAMKSGISAAYDNLSQLVDPNKLTPLQETKNVTASILSRRAESFIDGQGKAVDTVAEATRQPNGLTFDGIKGLRTHIGEMLDNGVFPEGMSEHELRGIYGGLSKDLNAAALNTGGPRAVAALERANELNKQVSDWKEGLKKVLGPDSRSGEGVAGAIQRMASNGPSADIETLAKARYAVPKEVWQDIASTTIQKLGISRNGEWTPAAYATDMRKLSDKGRLLLFKSVGSGDVLPYLDDIAKTSQKFVDSGKLANTSGTASHEALYAVGGTLAASTAHVLTGSGSWYEPLAVIGGLVGANRINSLLAKPATAASVARWTRTYVSYAKNPTAMTQASLRLASRNLSNTAAVEGIKFSPSDLIKSITSPAGADTGDQQDARPPTSQ